MSLSLKSERARVIKGWLVGGSLVVMVRDGYCVICGEGFPNFFQPDSGTRQCRMEGQPCQVVARVLYGYNLKMRSIADFNMRENEDQIYI